MPFNFFELGINFTQKVFTCYVSLRSHKLFNINKIYCLDILVQCLLIFLFQKHNNNRI
jgi:hypothetical protein